MAKFDNSIDSIEPIIEPKRQGDIPHSQASLEKVNQCISYQPKYSAAQGFEQSCEWYWKKLKF